MSGRIEFFDQWEVWKQDECLPIGVICWHQLIAGLENGQLDGLHGRHAQLAFQITRAHARQLKGLPIALRIPHCSRCRLSMMLRSGAYGSFFGCPNFRVCGAKPVAPADQIVTE